MPGLTGDQPKPTADQPAPRSSAQASRPKLSANQLRFLAEKADGMRARPLSLVIDRNIVDVVPTDEVKGKTVILDLETPSKGPGVTADAKVQVLWNGKTIGPGTKLVEADALFVTQSAIEKFLLPYYMRFKSAAEVQAMENSLFNKKNIIAAIHIPPSITYGLPGQEGPSKTGADDFGLGRVAILSSDPGSTQVTSQMV